MEVKATIASCINGDKNAERELFSLYVPKVFTICRRYSSCDADAKDLLQECFIHVFEKIKLFDIEKGTFDSWLYRVCVNRILRLIRKQRKVIPIVYMDVLPDEVAEEETKIEEIPKERLLAAVRELPEGYREVFNLHVIDDWSHKEIAAALGISVGTSRSQLSRAKVLLKKKLEAFKTTTYEKKWA